MFPTCILPYTLWLFLPTEFMYLYMILIDTVKPAHAVTSIKQSPVFKGHLFSCPAIEHYIWTFLKRSHVLKRPLFLCSKGDLSVQIWDYIYQNVLCCFFPRKIFQIHFFCSFLSTLTFVNFQLTVKLFPRGENIVSNIVSRLLR